MTSKEISLKEFESEVSSSKLKVNLNELIKACGASPVHMDYTANEVKILTTYPERVVLKSGDSLINISQIKKILRQKSDNGYTYELFCGLLRGTESVVKLSKI